MFLQSIVCDNHTEFVSDVAELLCTVVQSVIASACVPDVLGDPHLVAVAAGIVVESVDLGITLLDCDAVEVLGHCFTASFVPSGVHCCIRPHIQLQLIILMRFTAPVSLLYMLMGWIHTTLCSASSGVGAVDGHSGRHRYLPEARGGCGEGEWRCAGAGCPLCHAYASAGSEENGLLRGLRFH